MESIKRWKEKAMGSSRYHSSSSGGWFSNWLVGFTKRLVGVIHIGPPATFLLIGSALLLISCTTIKKAGITSIAAGGGALAGSVLSGGVAAPILGATTTAFVADVVTEVKMPTKASATVLQTEQGMIECAPDNFFTLLGKLVEMGGWLLVLIFVVPMILGWILPGPLTTHGKKRKERNLFS